MTNILANRYRLDARVAQGGMGAIYKGHDLQLDRPVAVKLMTEGYADPSARARFFREAKAAAGIQSPHIVQILDFGIDGATLFIVMEWLEGEDLRRRLKRDGPIEPLEVLVLLKQLAKGLRKAHERQVVHRDLKPANLFIAQMDGEPVLKILDFGIAKAADASEMTRTGLVLGSVPFISPEQARASRTLDHRSDLWSVAVIVYVALYARLPFPGDSETDMLVRICTESFVPPAEMFARFFDKAFQRDPNERYQSVDELCNAFALALGAPPIDVASSSRGPLPSLVTSAPPTSLATEPLEVGPAAHEAQTIAANVAFGPAPTSGRSLGAGPRSSSRAKAMVALASLVVVGSAVGIGALLARGGGSAEPASTTEAGHETLSATGAFSPAISESTAPLASPLVPVSTLASTERPAPSATTASASVSVSSSSKPVASVSSPVAATSAVRPNSSSAETAKTARPKPSATPIAVPKNPY